MKIIKLNGRFSMYREGYKHALRWNEGYCREVVLYERAMQEIPKMVRDIRSHATETVFARELNQLDEQSRALLEDVINYMEKKYISMPIKLAKEILLEKS
jgi:hypothetical protein